MEKRLFTLILFFLPALAFSQTKSEYKKTVYCEMIGTGNFSGNKIKISFDFGCQKFSYRASEDNMLVNDKGDPIDFLSMINALNYMAQKGWELHSVYSASIKGMGAQETHRYILMKKIDDDAEILDGIKLRGKFKEEQLNQKKEKRTFDDIYR